MGWGTMHSEALGALDDLGYSIWYGFMLRLYIPETVE